MKYFSLRINELRRYVYSLVQKISSGLFNFIYPTSQASYCTQLDTKFETVQQKQTLLDILRTSNSVVYLWVGCCSSLIRLEVTLCKQIETTLHLLDPASQFKHLQVYEVKEQRWVLINWNDIKQIDIIPTVFK